VLLQEEFYREREREREREIRGITERFVVVKTARRSRKTG
jgi:hypothetical protein